MDAELFTLIVGMLVFLGIFGIALLFDIFYIRPETRKEQNRKELKPVKIIDDFEDGCVIIKPDFYNPWGE